MKKYLTLIIIGLVLVSIVGIVSAQTFVPTEADNWLGRFISKIKFSIFELGTFTVAGDTLQCDKYPTSPSPIQFKEGTRKIVCASDYVVQSGFINFFRGSPYDGVYSDHPSDSRQFLGERFIVDGVSCWSWTCDAGDYWNNDCYIDFYGCEDQHCYSYNDCDSGDFCDKSVSELYDQTDGGGVCLEELPQHKTDVYSCENGNKVYLGEVSYGDSNFCTDPDDSKYLIGTTDQCLSYEPSICSVTICTDTCSSLGYECGTHTICGTSINCGTCGGGETCTNGQCVSGNGNGEVPIDCTSFQEADCLSHSECDWVDADSWIIDKHCVAKTNGNGDGNGDNGNGDENGDNGNGDGEEPSCKGKEEIFYTNVEGQTELKTWLFGSTKEITPQIIDYYITGFESKYFEEKGNACCEDLTYVYDDSKSKEITPVSVLKGILGSRTLTFTYDVYKCVPEGEGFCLEFAHTMLNKYTHTDCQTNTIILIVLTVFGFVMISRFAG